MYHVGVWTFVCVLVVGAAPAPSPGPVPTGAGSVVINEIAVGSFVELHNVSMSTVDIGRFELRLCGAAGVTDTIHLSVGQALAAGDFYLLASSSFTGSGADQGYAGVLPSGGVALYHLERGWADGAALIADSPCGEGDPAAACPGASTARDAVGTDTGRNAADFSCQRMSPREPNEAGSQPAAASRLGAGLKAGR
ncbi:MAG TPA: hypothetical protein VGX25_24885 [Actinophytocola sp.]|uniref:hypothetical protein n=1 Tax=Actinophytocola sp. TaxID=1872138 RepID=UPI002DDD5E2B|nr:hypothetical protein [Actinophytocola sp.]HEV2782640.1 hypothetical protein [Actinophytocola sp.]